jgi:hypothetical protein
MRILKTVFIFETVLRKKSLLRKTKSVLKINTDAIGVNFQIGVYS